MIGLALLIQINLCAVGGSSSAFYSQVNTYVALSPSAAKVCNDSRSERLAETNFFYSEYSLAEDSVQLRKLHRRARTANQFGIAALAILFVPLLNVVSLPLAIIAIVKGIKVKRELAANDPMKRTANKAIIAGILTVVLLGAAIFFFVSLYYLLQR